MLAFIPVGSIWLAFNGFTFMGVTFMGFAFMGFMLMGFAFMGFMFVGLTSGPCAGAGAIACWSGIC